ncbi:MAG TPA: Nif3-like dinuclear metal center hexameric protein [Candidatus Hydrogenedens sp.]|nr:Nif3-like dinuclear metal center hexameric protein [Candidatus Hydrogenedens sp.]
MNRAMAGIKIQDICNLIEMWAPLKLAYPNDTVGLVLGSKDWEADKVLVCLTITDNIVKESIKNSIKLIVSHHPLIYTPLNKITQDSSYGKRIAELISKGIACYTCHTNLDVAEKGLNHILAQKLEISNTTGLLPVEHTQLFKLVTFVPKNYVEKVREALCSCGAGIIGEYAYCSFSALGIGTFLPSENADPFLGKIGKVNEEKEERLEVLVSAEVLNNVIESMLEAHPYEEVAYDIYPLHNKNRKISLGLKGTLETPISLEEFTNRIKEKLNLTSVRVVGEMTKEIKNVAVIGGSGGSEIKKVPDNIDVLVTGDVKYHQALEAIDKGLAVIDAGHFGTEYPIVQGIYDYLKEKLPLLDVIIPEEKDPFFTK